jgi:hypothetical protein
MHTPGRGTQTFPVSQSSDNSPAAIAQGARGQLLVGRAPSRRRKAARRGHTSTGRAAARAHPPGGSSGDAGSEADAARPCSCLCRVARPRGGLQCHTETPQLLRAEMPTSNAPELQHGLGGIQGKRIARQDPLQHGLQRPHRNRNASGGHQACRVREGQQHPELAQNHGHPRTLAARTWSPTTLGRTPRKRRGGTGLASSGVVRRDTPLGEVIAQNINSGGAGEAARGPRCRFRHRRRRRVTVREQSATRTVAMPGMSTVAAGRRAGTNAATGVAATTATVRRGADARIAASVAAATIAAGEVPNSPSPPSQSCVRLKGCRGNAT